MKKLYRCSATELIGLLKNQKTSVEEIVSSFIKIVNKCDGNIKAWEFFDEKYIISVAKKLDKKKKYNKKLGSLFGIPVGIKDIFNTFDMPTTMGSEIWDGFTPGNDARVVHQIREDEGLIFGKTVTAEFGVHHLSSEKTVNPHDHRRTPGTSSSGSAVAVASCMVPLSLGTQTAGSIIRPASYCGVFGFKPSFGVVPRTGVLKTTDTLDTVGCFARNINDISLLFNSIRVKGSNYPFINKYLDYYEKFSDKNIKIGIISDGIWVFNNYKKYIIDLLNEYLEKLKANNHLQISHIRSSNHYNEVHNIHNTIYNKSLSYYFKKESNKMSDLSTIILQLIEIGSKISKSKYVNALNQQDQIRKSIENEICNYDIIITPAVASEAPFFGDKEIPDTCLIWTFLGMPALNIPLFKGPNGLPIGLQVISSRYSDYKLLDLAKRLILNN